MPSFAASLRCLDRQVDRKPLDARHGGDGLRAFLPSMTKIGQIRSSAGERVLAHQPAGPVGLAVASHARQELWLRGRRLRGEGFDGGGRGGRGRLLFVFGIERPDHAESASSGTLSICKLRR